MATYTYTSWWRGTVKTGSSIGNKTITIPAYTVPSGRKFKRFRIVRSGYYSGIVLKDPSNNIGWEKWSTDTKDISWSDGTTAKVIVRNTTDENKSVGIGIEFETEDVPYTSVKTGNKIMATDRSQTGTVTTKGAVMSDSHFTAGTLITASAFNTKVLGK